MITTSRYSPGTTSAPGLAVFRRVSNHGGGGATTRLVCGYLACDARLAALLLAGLPPVVHVNVRGSNAGSSPMQYLTQWRMLLAANLLCRSNAPLARIAEDVGYQTDTAFSRAFRREYGAPPAAWRRLRVPQCRLYDGSPPASPGCVGRAEPARAPCRSSPPAVDDRGGPEEQKIDPKLLNELRIDGREREDVGNAVPRWLWPVLAAVFAGVLLAGAGWWFFGGRPVVVQTAAATAAGGGNTGAVLQATGYITARRQATVSTQITGTLTQVLIEEGDRVEKGQVIARLEDSALRAGLNVAQAHIRTAEAQVVQAQAQLVQAEADARRQDELAASGMQSKQAAEQARTAVAAAAALLDARRRETDAARAEQAQAQVNFDYTIVRAPFAGVVTVKAAQVGEIVSPLSAGGGFTRTGVGTIVDMDSLEVDVDVNEAYIGQVKPDMPAEAVLDAYPDWKIPAHVIAIVPAADRGKATVKVRVALEQKDARMVPDMGVRVSFLAQKTTAAPAQAPKGVLVPAQALAEREGRSVVFVVADGKALQRAVTPAPQDLGTMKLLPAGVSAGERVVLSPPPTLHDGSDVRIETEPR